MLYIMQEKVPETKSIYKWDKITRFTESRENE